MNYKTVKNEKVLDSFVRERRKKQKKNRGGDNSISTLRAKKAMRPNWENGTILKKNSVSPGNVPLADATVVSIYIPNFPFFLFMVNNGLPRSRF